MYSAKVVEKILAGKQMKRSIEAHTTTILAICCIYIRSRMSVRENKDDIIELIKEMKRNLHVDDDSVFQSCINVFTSKFKALEVNKLFGR